MAQSKELITANGRVELYISVDRHKLAELLSTARVEGVVGPIDSLIRQAALVAPSNNVLDEEFAEVEEEPEQVPRKRVTPNDTGAGKVRAAMLHLPNAERWTQVGFTASDLWQALTPSLRPRNKSLMGSMLANFQKMGFLRRMAPGRYVIASGA